MRDPFAARNEPTTMIALHRAHPSPSLVASAARSARAIARSGDDRRAIDATSAPSSRRASAVKTCAGASIPARAPSASVHDRGMRIDDLSSRRITNIFDHDPVLWTLGLVPHVQRVIGDDASAMKAIALAEAAHSLFRVGLAEVAPIVERRVALLKIAQGPLSK